jgi:hypothetical protein
MRPRSTEPKTRFNLTLPSSLRRKLEEVSEEHQTDVTKSIQKSTKLLLLGEEASKKGGGLYVRRNRDSDYEKIDIYGL